MIRRAFLRRMALAAAACAFIDVPWPKAAREGELVNEVLQPRSWKPLRLPSETIYDEELLTRWIVAAMREQTPEHRMFNA